MKRILHIRTRKEDPLAAAAIAEQQRQSQVTVQTFDMTEPQPDYDQLLKQIFEADSVHVW